MSSLKHNQTGSQTSEELFYASVETVHHSHYVSKATSSLDGADFIRKEYAIIIKSFASKDFGIGAGLGRCSLFDPEKSDLILSEDKFSFIESVLKVFCDKKAFATNMFSKCPAFVNDFATLIDALGYIVNASNWRKALFLFLQLDERFAPGPRVLTPAGAWAVTVAYTHNFPAAVRNHVDAPILSVSPATTGTTIEHYCRYFYYVGLIKAGYHAFEGASYMFETALAIKHPETVSHAVAANKALFVTAAAARGEIARVFVSMSAKGTTGEILALAKRGAGAKGPLSAEDLVAAFKLYNNFASAYVTNPAKLGEASKSILAAANSTKALQEARSRHPSTSGDVARAATDAGIALGTERLLKVACDDRPRQQIMKLTHVYSNLPLSALAEEIGVDKDYARAQLDFLVATGRVGATIDSESEFVRFTNVAPMTKGDVEVSVSRLVSLGEALERVRTSVLCSSEYARSREGFLDIVEREVAEAVVR